MGCSRERSGGSWRSLTSAQGWGWRYGSWATCEEAQQRNWGPTKRKVCREEYPCVCVGVNSIHDHTGLAWLSRPSAGEEARGFNLQLPWVCGLSGASSCCSGKGAHSSPAFGRGCAQVVKPEPCSYPCLPPASLQVDCGAQYLSGSTGRGVSVTRLLSTETGITEKLKQHVRWTAELAMQR